MRRLGIAMLAALLLAGLVAPAVGAVQTVAAAAPVPKVVVIVGPAGRATDRYRSEARAAAALARKYTPDVTELYSPEATWPAVKAALQGASLVIYMGHGNGWPSKYRDHLYPPTQNGFGLNPSAGSGDTTHQYFGEGPIAKHIELAKNAVVLLNHLCYASGNTEPGLPEGTLDQARQRVDNFAAGFIKAGAAAVVAEAHASPDHMVRAVLGTKRSVESAWRTAPSRNGNAFAFESARSPGYVAQMDPESADAGFTRSIVLKEGLASADVQRGARGSASPTGTIDGSALAPTLAAVGLETATPVLASTAAGSTIRYKVPFTAEDRSSMPKSIKASVRWDALDPVIPGVTPVAEDGAETATEAPAQEGGAAPAEATAEPAAEETPEPPAEATEPPDLGLVTPERIGDVVDPVKVKLSKKSFSFNVTTPATPGRYRLTVVLHDADGVAYDAATQALLPSLLVRVTGDLDATIVAPAQVEARAGGPADLDLWVANVGSTDWGHEQLATTIPGVDPSPTRATVTGQWMPLGVATPEALAAAAAVSATADLPAGMTPGDVHPVALELFAPSVPGDYLLVIDIVTPERGSITAAGVAPTIVRVRVAG